MYTPYPTIKRNAPFEFPGFEIPDNNKERKNKIQEKEVTGRWTQVSPEALDKNPNGDVLLCYICPVVGWPVFRVGFIDESGKIFLRKAEPGIDIYELGHVSKLGPVFYSELPLMPHELMRDIFDRMMKN